MIPSSKANGQFESGENNNSEKFFKPDIDEKKFFFSFCFRRTSGIYFIFPIFCRLYHVRHENDTVLNDEILAIFPESFISFGE